MKKSFKDRLIIKQHLEWYEAFATAFNRALSPVTTGPSVFYTPLWNGQEENELKGWFTWK